MIVQWNGEGLEMKEHYGCWGCRSLRGGRGALNVSRVNEDGPWFAFLWFFGTRVRFEVFGCDTAQDAVDQVYAACAAAHPALGVALNGLESGDPETFPRRWQDCLEFVECLRAREYIVNIGSGDEGLVAMSAGIYLYMYELWQDGKRGSGA